MRKIIRSLYFTCLGCFTCLALQAQKIMPAGKPNLSAATKLYMFQQQGSTVPTPGYVYKKDAQQRIYVSAFMRVKPGFSATALLAAYDIHTGTRAGNIWTVQVPLDQFAAFTQIPGIDYIDVDMPVAPFLDKARAAANVDSVHAGAAPLPHPFSGKNVVTGIIDAGFDYTHPAFYDTSYETYRVKRVWEQKNNSGNNPTGFSYGTELTDSLAIHQKAYDITTETHGTHVAGIAAGAGTGGAAGNNNLYRGMAYGSDLVMVAIYPDDAHWQTTGCTDLLDGIQYIFQYGTVVGKPAVANLSWGGAVGPRDGHSLFSEACDAITGPGKLFVLSAGNNGSTNMHLSKIFTAADTSVSSIINFSTSFSEKHTLIDIWGDTGKTFCTRISLLNGLSYTDSTVFVCLDDNVHTFNLVGSDGDTCTVTMSTAISEYNGKPHILVEVNSRTTNTVCITTTGTEGHVDHWQGIIRTPYGYYGSFGSGGYSWTRNGDNQMTISDIASTQSAITVGAYNSKVDYYNVAGQHMTYTGYLQGRIAAFSSKGPTADGRTKPDITGPGLALASSVNSYNPDYAAGGSSYNAVAALYNSPRNSRTYAYAMAGGTSMSSPAVAGILSLILEANPALTPQGAKDLLAATAITDSYTGTIPADGSPVWGFGKVNAFRALLQTLGLTTTEEQQVTSTDECYVFPNPSNGQYHIIYNTTGREQVFLYVMNLQGQLLQEMSWLTTPGINLHALDLQSLPPGSYLLHIKNGERSKTLKLTKH